MSARLFLRISIKIVLVLAIPLFVFGSTTTTAFAQSITPHRTLQDYIDLFGANHNPIPQDDTASQAAIRAASQSGIIYDGPVPKDQGGFSDQGDLKKIATTISLTLDMSKFRAWDMVAAIYEPSIDFNFSLWGLSIVGSNKYYLRFVDQSFLVRVYQKDASGNVINEQVTYPDNHTFVQSKAESDSLLQGKPLPYLFKFNSGDAPFTNTGNIYEDGYTVDPNNGNTLLILNGAAPVLTTKQTALINLDVSNLAKGQKTYMELWYAGSDRESSVCTVNCVPGGPNNSNPAGYPNKLAEGPSVKYFDNGPNNRTWPYFQIGGTVEFTTPQTLTDAQTQANTGAAQQATVTNNLSTNEGVLPECGVGSFIGCIARVFYYAIYSPIQWFAGIMGKVFDFFLGYSLDDASYRADFIVTAWKVIRDISNVFFIIILIYTGLAAVFEAEGVSMKKVVPALIVNALIINFSLFITRLAVDVSNITARVFYNSVHVQNSSGQSLDTSSPGGYKPLSVKIVSIFDPQQLFDPKNASASALPSAVQIDQNGTPVTDSQLQKRDSNSYALYFIVVSAIAAAIVFGIAKMFWKSGFFFLGRVIGLYIVMIFSPFAFLTRGSMPLVGSIDRLKWSDWLKELTDYALLAPIFVFFLYIIYILANSQFLQNTRNAIVSGGGILNVILSISIPMLIIYFMISYGVDIAKRYAGFVGGKIQDFIDKSTGAIVGGAVGIASGGSSLVLRNAIARPLDVITKKSGFQSFLASKQSSSRLARFGNAILNKNRTASYDVRNLGVKVAGKDYTVGKSLFQNGLGSLLGAKVQDNVSSKIGVGQDKALGKNGKPGGIQKIDDERNKRKAVNLKRRLMFSHLSDEEAKKAWNTYTKERIEKLGKTTWKSDQFIDQEADVKPHKDALDALKKEEAALKASIATDRAAGKTADAARGEAGLKVNQDKQKAKTEDMAKARLETIKNLEKDKKYEKSAAFEKAKQAEKDRLDKYGDVKNAKTLGSAMRAEYAQKLRNKSFWMKNGQIRKLQLLGIGESAGAMAAASFIPMVGPAFGAAFANYIQSNADVMDAATKSIIEEHAKSVGKKSKLGKYLDKIAKANKAMEEALNDSIHGDTFKGKKVDDIDADELEKAINEAIAENQSRADDITEKLRIAKNMSEDDKHKLQKERANLRQKIDKWRKAQDDKDKAQEEMDKYNETRKKEEDAKEKSEDKKSDDGKK